MSVKKAEHARERGEPAGDCVDCNQCVAVCPTGVDIRDGLQLGCMQCGLCIDACDNVMRQIGRPERLIAYDTDMNIARRAKGEEPIYRIVRARTILYAVIIAIVGAVMLYSLATRRMTDVSVLHERNPLFTRLSDGGVRNAYTVRFLNKGSAEATFVLAVDGLSQAHVQIVGVETDAKGGLEVLVGPDQTREVRVLITAPKDAVPATSTEVTFRGTAASGEASIAREHFIPN